MEQMTTYEQTQKQQMIKLLNSFDDAILSGDNCDAAIFAILDFANITGIALQHADFNNFSKAMMSDDSFVLG